MKIVIPGGTGHLGTLLVRDFEAAGHEVIVLSRRPRALNHLVWDGRTLGEWARAFDGADVVINLAGRTVDCRYTATNLAQMMDSRVDSTRVVGEAIAAARTPPRVWLQMSTATLYAHRFDAPNDEMTGHIGGDEPGAPARWRPSIEIAKAWEATCLAAETPHTRRALLRTAMVMSNERGGVFDILSRLARWGLGGTMAGGRQFVSWIHASDFCKAVQRIIDDESLSGPVNLAAPAPLPQREFMRILRSAWGVSIGLPATTWMLEIGAFFLRTDTELLLKSRRVVPGRLEDAGFVFRHGDWADAALDLVEQRRAQRGHSQPVIAQSE